ncbi:MAG: hypothetical protein K9M81_06235 [Chthoniobacterales bacterium]|nr:hypothetical protein [Chthoniobacterales bacterium]
MASLSFASPLQLAPTLSATSKKFLADLQKTESTASNTDNAPSSLVEAEDSLDPLKITLSPEQKIGPIPKWALAPHIDEESSLVEIPIPSLAERTDIENFVITVNFMDMGDGGPLIEKQNKNDSNSSLLCSGLGINGPALGINSRNILIPNDLAIDGGKIIVRHAGRFKQLHSIILRPGRTAIVSALHENNIPAIIDHSTIIPQDLAEGATPVLKKGDTTHGHVTTASLSPSIEELDSSIQFNFDISRKPQATLFQTDILGLDLKAHIDVELNGKSIGPLNVSSFEFDSAELITETKTNDLLPQHLIAGWRSAYIYIAYDYLREKDNHLLLTVQPSGNSHGYKIHLKNSSLKMLHGDEPHPR